MKHFDLIMSALLLAIHIVLLIFHPVSTKTLTVLV
jgi:hypothetical protein